MTKLSDDLAFKNKALEFIKDQIGLELELCDYFTEVQDGNGNPGFNVTLKDRLWGSQEYNKLIRLQQNSAVLAEIQPNGVRRLFLTFDPDNL